MEEVCAQELYNGAVCVHTFRKIHSVMHVVPTDPCCFYDVRTRLVLHYVLCQKK